MSNAIVEVNRAVKHEPGKSAPGRIDKGKALELRFKKGKTLQEIADYFGVSVPAVCKCLRKLLSVFDSPETLRAYENIKTDLLTAVEMRLVSEIVNEDKLKAASLNNVAYSLKQIHEMNRLEKDLSTANVAAKLIFHVVHEGQEASAKTAESRAPSEGTEPQDIDSQASDNGSE